MPDSNSGTYHNNRKSEEFFSKYGRTTFLILFCKNNCDLTRRCAHVGVQKKSWIHKDIEEAFWRLVVQKWKDSLNVAAAEPHSLDAGKEAEVGKVTLKSNGDEVLSDEPP